MQQNFIFYDTETSDRDPFFGQIFQFAAVLTDADLNPIDSFDIRYKLLIIFIKMVAEEGLEPPTRGL